MAMPGRGGRSGSGGWVSSSGTSSLPASPSYDSSRTTSSPAEYKATVSIEFLPGFESREVDAFEAYITTDDGNGGTGTGDQGYAGGGYRYGFNGKENDDETSTQDYGMRIYDPRVGRFLSIDPLQKQYPWYTPYQFSGNTPIQATDLDGLEEIHYTLTLDKSGQPQLKYVKTVEEKSFLFFFSYTPVETKVIEYKGDNYEFTAGGYSSSPMSDMGANSYKNLDLWLNSGYKQIPFDRAFYSAYAKNLMDAGDVAEGVSTEVAVGKSWAKSNPNSLEEVSPTAKTNNKTTSAHGGNTEAAETNQANATKKLKIGTYSAMKKENAGTGMSADHIPSYAAAKQMKEKALGRALTTAETRALRNSTLTLSVETKLHQSTSQTYAGRNTPSKISADAADPLKAIRDNVNAYRPALIKEGYTNAEIDNAIETLSTPYKPKSTTKKE